MALSSMVKGLHPLNAGGGGGRQTRPFGMPTMQSSPPANAVGYFEDFFSTALGPAGWGGLAYGTPSWSITQIGATAGSVGVGGVSSTYAGILALNTGASCGLIAEPIGRVSTTTSLINMAGDYSLMWRVAFGGTRSTRQDIWAFVQSSLATATDIVTDWYSTIGLSPHIALCRSTAAAYDSMTAGDFYLRTYDGTTTTKTLLKADAGIGSGFYKVEVAVRSGVLTAWLDGVQVASYAVGSGLTSGTQRPTAQILSLTASARFQQTDCLYAESSLTSPR